MAKKEEKEIIKNEEIENKNEEIIETEEKDVKNEKNSQKGAKKEELIKVRVPIDPLNPEDKEIIVGINDKYAKVIRGEETEVSRPVYEQLVNAKLI